MDVLSLRARALEQSFHKRESESALSERRKALEREGRLPKESQGKPVPAEWQHATIDKLGEIYAEETRVSPKLPSERRFARRNMPPIPSNPAIRSSTHPLSHSVDSATPAVASVRQAIVHVNSSSISKPNQAQPTPEELEAMRLKHIVSSRAFSAGARSLAYGFAAAVVGTVALARAGSYLLGIHNLSDARLLAQPYTRRSTFASVSSPSSAAQSSEAASSSTGDECSSAAMFPNESVSSVNQTSDTASTLATQTSTLAPSETLRRSSGEIRNESSHAEHSSSKVEGRAARKAELELARRLKIKFGT
jgi:hypothetical protein